MKKPTESQWSCARELTLYLLRCLDRGRSAEPWTADTDFSWSAVGEYLVGVDFEEDLDEALSFTFGSALALGNDLARAHSAASLIQVRMPDKMTAARLAEDLEAIDEAVSDDQKFATVAEVSGALATALQS